MADVKEVVAEPSAATINAPAEIDLSKLSSEQRSTWRTTGKLPDSPKESEEAESSDAPKEAESEPEGKSEAESEPAPKQEPRKAKPAPHKLTAEERIAQLTAKLKDAEEKLKAKAEPAPKSEEKPKPEEKKPEPSQELAPPKKPVRPQIKDFDGSAGKTVDDYDAALEKYEAERDEYIEKMAEYKAAITRKEIEAEQSQKEALGKLQKDWSDARERYGEEFDSIAQPVIDGMADKNVHPAVLQAMRNAKNPLDLLYTIGGDEAERDAFLQDAKTNPVNAIRKMGVYEYLVAEALKGGEKSKPKKAPEKPVTSVPPPVREVGGSGSSTEEPGVAAARANDVRGAFREWNRQASEGRLR